jgi:ribose transport system ATP-binding protein
MVRGRPLRRNSPRAAVRHRVGLLTEDRKDQGLLMDLPIAANISLAGIGKVSRGGLLLAAAERAVATTLARRLRIKSSGPRQHPRALSGGNQQKVLLGRWLAADTDLLIVDEPTRGIDVGARYEIHQLLLDLAGAGKGILMVSSDLPELLGICDRLLVFSRGQIAGELSRADFDPERVLNLAYSAYRKDTPMLHSMMDGESR